MKHSPLPRTLAITLFVLTLSVFSPGTLTEAAEKPNIVFILADDMGYGDLKAFNPESRIRTPHLDSLAKSGICFTDAHSGGSTCIPSRYSLLTDRFSARKAGFNANQPVIAEDHQTVAGMLRHHGYQTAMVGKWHLGFQRKSIPDENGKPRLDFDYDHPLAGGPVDRGFDSFFGMHASLDIQPYFYIRDRAPVLPPTERVDARSSVGGKENWNNIQGAFWRAGDISPDFKHAEVTPRFANEASRVIETHNGEKPLFLYLALPSPHTPWLPAEKFAGKSKAGMYGDFVMTVDSVVGQILKSLNKAGMSDNTLVMFSSDNGPVRYDKDTERYGHRSVGPLRGIKASVWEGGHRVPFIARWPGHIQAGIKSGRVIAFADIFATLAQIAGPEETPATTAVDSVSFLPTLLHPDRRQPARPPVLHDGKVIRAGDWKLIDTKGRRGFNAERGIPYGIELYNLKNDLSETNNLAEQMPQKVEHLRAETRKILEGSVDEK